MKSIHILIFAVLLTACSTDPSKKAKANETSTAATAATEASMSDAPVMTFDKLSHDFGTIN